MLRILLTTIFVISSIVLAAQKQKVWIDSDTGNEVDDIYAIVRMLTETEVEVVGLSSVHFNNPDLLVFENWNQYNTRSISTINISQSLNENILNKLKRNDVICCQGADRQIGRAWGGIEPRISEAVEQLVSFVNDLSSDEHLDIICLGALTNLASALILYPEIIPKVRCYMLGAQYDSELGIWNKNEFNIRNDLNAFDYLMSLDTIDLTIMPITTALSFRFRKKEIFERFSRSIPVYNLLKERWEETEASSEERTLWDLALIEAYLAPENAIIEKRLVPPENGEKYKKVYTKIDTHKLYQAFWNSMIVK